jgi:hypothetical protein
MLRGRNWHAGSSRRLPNIGVERLSSAAFSGHVQVAQHNQSRRRLPVKSGAAFQFQFPKSIRVDAVSGDRFKAVPDVHFVADVLHVCANGFYTDAQFVANFLVDKT